MSGAEIPIIAGCSAFGVLTSSTIAVALHNGTAVGRWWWRKTWGCRRYEVLWSNLSDSKEASKMDKITNLLRFIGKHSYIQDNLDGIIRLDLPSETDPGTMEKVYIPSRPFYFKTLGMKRWVWASVMRDHAGSIIGFEFWSYRYGFFSWVWASRSEAMWDMVNTVDKIIDGSVRAFATSKKKRPKGYEVPIIVG